MKKWTIFKTNDSTIFLQKWEQRSNQSNPYRVVYRGDHPLLSWFFSTTKPVLDRTASNLCSPRFWAGTILSVLFKDYSPRNTLLGGGPGTLFSESANILTQIAEDVDSNPAPEIELQNYTPPENAIDEILKKLFPNIQTYKKLEWKSGFTQSIVLLMQRFSDGKEKLPVVVKIAPSYIIAKERDAYQTHIKEYLPNAVGLKDKVETKDKKWAALCYELAGDGAHDSTNLLEYLSSDEVDLIKVKNTLKPFLEDSIDMIWRQSKILSNFSFWNSYDRVLPVNLVVQYEDISSKEKPIVLSSKGTEQFRLDTKIDYPICLEKFQIVDISYHENMPSRIDYILNCPTQNNRHFGQNNSNPKSYRIRLTCHAPHLAKFSPYQIPKRITGRVISTRQHLLYAAAQEAFTTQLDLHNDTISWDGTKLPNPLNSITEIFKKQISVRQSSIHGDLHVQNVRVDPNSSRINLIDFADARSDHVLHDLFRLETSLVTNWLSKVFQENGFSSNAIYQFYQQLHCTTFHSSPIQSDFLHNTALEKPLFVLQLIREAALENMFKKKLYQEYYDGLTLYLLGALKFKELKPFARQVAFLGAAACQDLSSRKI